MLSRFECGNLSVEDSSTVLQVTRCSYVFRMQIKKYITRFTGQTIPTFVILSFLTDLQIVKASQPRSRLSINFGA